MTCEELRILLDGFVDGEPTPEEQEHVNAHTADCANCAREPESLEAVAAAARAGCERNTSRPRPWTTRQNPCIQGSC